MDSGTLIPLNALTGKDLNINDSTDMPEGTRNEVSFIGSFLTKIARKVFFWRELCFTLGRDLPTSTSPAETSAPMYPIPGIHPDDWAVFTQ